VAKNPRAERMTSRFRISDDFLSWAESLSAMLTTVETKSGGVATMLENPAWDESRTDYALHLVKSLHAHIRKLDEEMTDHVQGKCG
jgi:hypothetical protein